MADRAKFSLCVTTLNNESTIGRCLESAPCADEIIVLDSYSSDGTVAIAERAGAKVHQQTFAGYGPQKQAAIDLASHDWVLLLDADEELTPRAQDEIVDVLTQLATKAQDVTGFELPRIEQMFWRMQSANSRLNYFLRLFDRRRSKMSDMPVHAAPKTDGRVLRMESPFLHFGEPDIHTKVAKINAYSSGLVADKAHKRGAWWRMIVYPPYAFLRSYVIKRQFLNGWAGFIASVVMAFYAFLKYAKLFEYQQNESGGTTQDGPRRQDPSTNPDKASEESREPR